jgi:simple sugar transport system permease protein
MLDLVFSVESFIAALNLATPILLASLGAAICLKAGIFNISLEGCILIGAFSAVIASHYSSNPYVGFLMALVSGIVFSLILGVLHINLKADPIIAGLALNLLAEALTAWLLISVLNSPGSFYQIELKGLPNVELPVINQIPFLGTILSGRTMLTYLAWVLTLVIYLFMKRSVLSLRIRAVGEHADAARTAGINVKAIKFLALILCGALCGIAGADLSLTNLRMFTQGMSAGRGFIAFTAAAFTAGSILPTAFISILFSIFLSLAIRLEGFGLPTHFLQMIPYVMTIIMLVFESQSQKLFRRQQASKAG